MVNYRLVIPRHIRIAESLWSLVEVITVLCTITPTATSDPLVVIHPAAVTTSCFPIKIAPIPIGRQVCGLS